MKIATINGSEGSKVIVTFDREYDEYTCKLYVLDGGKLVHYKPADYFTGDEGDAMDTAKAMAE